MAEITVHYEGPIVTRPEAMALGLKRYFTGKPCKHGHVDERYISSKQCVRCLLIHAETEEYKADQQFYAYIYRGTPARKAAALRYAQSEKGKAARSVYEDTDAFKRINRESKSKYRKSPKGKDASRVASAVRRARKRGAPIGSFTAEDELKLRQRQKKCHICDRRFTKADPAALDHVIALGGKSLKGTHDASNIALAHHSCNLRKHARRMYLI